MRRLVLFFTVIGVLALLGKAQSITKSRWKPLGPFEVPKGTADTGQWTANGVGWVESLAVAGRKEKTLYAGSNVGGLFVSRNKGMTWKFRFDVNRVCGVWDIVVDKQRSKRLWVATGTNTWDYNWGHGVLYSKNRGKTWRKTGLSFLPEEKQVVYALERSQVDPSVFFACTETDVYRSNDQTKTWFKVLDFDDKTRVTFRHLELHNRNPDQVVASGARLLFSYNGGETWEQKDSLMSFYGKRTKRDSLPSRFAVALNPQNNNQVMVVYSHKRINYIERSNDFGKTWFNVFKGRDFDRVDLNHAEIVWDPLDSNRIIVGSVRLYLSDNQGKTFDLVSEPKAYSPRFMHDDIRALTISSKGTYWVGCDGGVSMSEDTCRSWVDVSGYGLQASQFYDIAVDNGNLVGGCQDLSTMLYHNGEWKHTSAIYGDGGMNLIQGNNLIVMQNGMRLRNGSYANDKWGVYYTPFTPKRFKYPFLFSPTDSTRIWATDHDIWEMGPNKQWKNLTKSIPHSATKIVALDASSPDSSVVYFAKDQPTWNGSKEGLKNRFYKGVRTSNGYEWSDITANLPILAWREITSISASTQNPNVMYVSLYGFDDGETRHRVYRSEDAGITWSNFSEGLPNLNSLKIIQYDNDRSLFLATDEGVFHRRTTDERWVKLSRGLPNCHVIDIEIDATLNRLYAASFGNGIWYLDLP
ncbi:MAG: hypothetical protein JJ975_04820 [Bacteroidia bacterium]|nr:hypothetical protein [Bacteroidia bacterium]